MQGLRALWRPLDVKLWGGHGFSPSADGCVVGVLSRWLALRVGMCFAVLCGAMALGCIRAGTSSAFVGEWVGGKESLVVRGNGLAEGQLFNAQAPQVFTWRPEGQGMKLTCGRIASDPIEYRATIDEAGRLVVDGDAGRCVLTSATTTTRR